MFAFLREWIQEIVILLVLATFIDLALPNSSLKKYVDYTVGLILLLLLLTPVLKLINSELDVSTRLASAEQHSGRAMVTAVEPLSDKSAWLAYNLVLEARVAQLAEEIDIIQSATATVTVDQNSASPSYGNPTTIELTVALRKPLAESDSGEQIRRQLSDKLRTTYGLETIQVRIHIKR
ncbi:MAG: stage III sporulation protein AF [Bacillota bacterium]|nr:MAG: stage III sporulation protein AF [Bacillota bacterium]MBS3951326.1 stage III sporulation protein AF [Peptococcaceae bacterium]